MWLFFSIICQQTDFDIYRQRMLLKTDVNVFKYIDDE